MLKYCETEMTFSEFPDEVALCVNISRCPCKCSYCYEPWLQLDAGDWLTEEAIDKLIKDNPGLTLFGFMGGDSDHTSVYTAAKYIKEKYPSLKVGMYSGLEYLDNELMEVLDYYKIGRFIMPDGKQEDWHKSNNGSLQFPWSNQLMFRKEIINGKVIWKNITSMFRKAPISELERYVIKDVNKKLP